MKGLNITNEDNMLLMARYPDNHFDLAIVDPPYFEGVNKSGYYGAGYSTLKVKRAKYYNGTKHWEIPDEKYFKELIRVSKNQIIWGANHFCDRFNASSSSWIIWDKCRSGSSFADAELAYTSFDSAAVIFKFMWNGMLQGKSISEGHIMQGNKKLNEKRIHETQKPVLLYKWILDKYAKIGDKILDTHLGSGSIAIACHDYGFDLTACELDFDYYSAAIKRIEQHTNQQSLFL